MRDRLTIGEVSRRLGMPSKTIRFYEAKGVVTAPGRTEAGYRFYSPTDIRRLRLAKRARLLGLSLQQVKAFVDQAFASECSEFGEAILEQIAAQRGEVHRRIAELEALESEFAALERHVRHNRLQVQRGQLVAGCVFCPLIDEEEGG